ncbi:MAG: sortase [Candidatus Pacebacteria bacterium]|nr:sortase [Candidatus Paceibacterota bacterium]
MNKDLKLFLQIFLIIFIVLFFIINGSAFPNWLDYKISEITEFFQKELFRFPGFLTKVSLPESEAPAENLIDRNISKFESPDLIRQPAEPPIPPEASETNLIELPKFSIKAPIITVTEPNLDLIYKELKKGVVLYPGSSVPGEGYSIIIGHSSQYPWEEGNYKSVFSLLNELNPGDQIYVFWEQKPLVFEVQDKKIFTPWPKGSETTETIFPPNSEESILILQSCWPVGVASKRVAVKTVLVR